MIFLSNNINIILVFFLDFHINYFALWFLFLTIFVIFCYQCFPNFIKEIYLFIFFKFVAYIRKYLCCKSIEIDPFPIYMNLVLICVLFFNNIFYVFFVYWTVKYFFSFLNTIANFSSKLLILMNY